MPCAGGSRASERRLPTTPFHKQSRTPTIRGETFSDGDDGTACTSPASSAGLARGAGSRPRQNFSTSHTKAVTPPKRRSRAWFSAWFSQSLERICTASVRSAAAAETSLKRRSMILTASKAPSSSCSPGSPTTEMRSIRAPWIRLPGGASALGFGGALDKSPSVASSASVSVDGSQASKKRRATMCPRRAWNAAGARGARFKSTAMACCCKTWTCVRGNRRSTEGTTRGVRGAGGGGRAGRTAGGSGNGASEASSVFADAIVPGVGGPSSSSCGGRRVGGSTVSESSRPTSKYINSAPIKSASTMNSKFAWSRRPRSESSVQTMRFISKSSSEEVAKLCRSARGPPSSKPVAAASLPHAPKDAGDADSS
mmetsp:Transcript_14275/g.49677  ORF Transcript_14275/g.49677 Transcript_14275/m.49677 type:complete len:369 (-) Transcript_14275:1446-2552(-)